MKTKPPRNPNAHSAETRAPNTATKPPPDVTIPTTMTNTAKASAKPKMLPASYQQSQSHNDAGLLVAVPEPRPSAFGRKLIRRGRLHPACGHLFYGGNKLLRLDVCEIGATGQDCECRHRFSRVGPEGILPAGIVNLAAMSSQELPPANGDVS